jgi:hypothetical protein
MAIIKQMTFPNITVTEHPAGFPYVNFPAKKQVIEGPEIYKNENHRVGFYPTDTVVDVITNDPMFLEYPLKAGELEKLEAICNTVFTQEAKDTYIAFQAND